MRINITEETLATKSEQDNKLVIFDGDCGICTKTAEWIEQKDKDDKLTVKPFQILDLDKYDLELEQVQTSVYFISEGKKFRKARAVYEILKQLPGFWGFLGTAASNSFIAWISNPFYVLIARNRTKVSRIFGLDACKIEDWK